MFNIILDFLFHIYRLRNLGLRTFVWINLATFSDFNPVLALSRPPLSQFVVDHTSVRSTFLVKSLTLRLVCLDARQRSTPNFLGVDKP